MGKKINVYLSDEEGTFMKEHDIKPGKLFRPVVQALMRGEGVGDSGVVNRKVKLRVFSVSRSSRRNGFPLAPGERIISADTNDSNDVVSVLVESVVEGES